jgi:hypothetical protein
MKKQFYCYFQALRGQERKLDSFCDSAEVFAVVLSLCNPDAILPIKLHRYIKNLTLLQYTAMELSGESVTGKRKKSARAGYFVLLFAQTADILSTEMRKSLLKLRFTVLDSSYWVSW